MIKLVGIVVHNFTALTRYSFRFYFRHITVIITGLTDLCKNVERKCIYIANAASSVIVDPLLNIENEYIFNVLYGKALDCVA